jgi:hypothetical protein
MADGSAIYVLAWYSDGGKPELRFLGALRALDAIRYAAEKASAGCSIECGEATEINAPPAGAPK